MLMRGVKWLWNSWKGIARCIGDFQARLLLTVFYFTAVAPFGLVTRLVVQPWRLRNAAGTSGWMQSQTREMDLPGAQKQF